MSGRAHGRLRRPALLLVLLALPALPAAAAAPPAAPPPPAVFGAPWFPNRLPNETALNASAGVLTWGPPLHKPDALVTYLPRPLALDRDGARARLELTWQSDGADDCPPRDWADHGFCKNDEPCMHTSVHCLAGTGDFRIGLLDSNGAGRVAGPGWAHTDPSYSGVNKALSRPPFSGYLGYSFRISPHVSTKATEYTPTISKSTAVPCSFNWNGLEHAGHALSKERLAKTGCFEAPTGKPVPMTLEIERRSTTEAVLTMRMGNVSYTYHHHIRGGKTEEARMPKKIDTVLIQYPNGRKYTYVKLAPPSPPSSPASDELPSSSSSSCKTDMDCALNGVCTAASTCLCDPAWTGPKCATLAILPATRASGYRVMDNASLGGNLSSWGGGGWYDSTTDKFYMWASEMYGHCGMHTWTTNSQTIRASSDTATGLYQREAVQFPIWSHEADVTRAPDGTWVAFFSYNADEGATGREVCKLCTDGSTPDACKNKKTEKKNRTGRRRRLIENTDPTYMSWSPTPAGPWSKPVLVLGPSVVPKMTPMDTNLAAVILNDSKRLVGMWRDHEPTGKSVPHLVTASDWRDPATYKFSRDDLLFGKKVPDGGNDEDESSGMLRHHHAKNPGGLEDMFLWRDKRGHFHAVFHQMFDCDACTAHAYSADGTEWHYSGTAAPPDTTYSDGTKEVFSHSERPHILFDKDGVTPVALTNGVKIQGRSNDDQSFTLLRPLRRASGKAPSSAALSTSHSDDLAGLTDFASALNYKSWVKNTHWMDTKTSVCKWHGVTCDDKSGRVTEISLEHNRLNGTLPASLGDRLTELTSLNLNGGRPADYQGCAGNDFRRSPLPASFYKMSKLQIVNLEYTCLGGTLADAFHNMTSLTELSLHGNFLSGEIPRSLNHSVNLNTLKLGRNPITGSFPWFLSGLTKAVQLNCNFCALTGVVPDDAFLNWPELEETYWDGNGFTGTLPSSLGTLKKLTRVSFNINQFSGPLPASWAAMPALKDCRIGSDTNLTAYLANYPWIPKTSGNLYDCPLPAYATGGGVCNHVSNCADVTSPCSPVNCKKNKMTTATATATAPMAIKQCALQRIGPPAARAATSVLGAFAVFFVEAHRSDPMSGSVNIFDAQERAWRPAGSLSRGSYSRTNVCATSWQHLAMFAGGTAEPGAAKSDIVDVWNSETDTWSVMHLKQGRDLLACASVGQVTLFAGGSVKIPGQPDTTDSVEIWHHNTETWTTHKLSEPRKKAEAVAVGVYIVIAGGETANASGHTGYSSTIDVYDERYGGSWSVAQMASPRQYFGVAYASGHAFGVAAVAMFAGGFYNDVRLGDVDVFDPSTGRHLDTLANGTVVHPTLGQNRSNLRGLSIGSGGRYAAFGPGNIATAAKTSLDFYDAEAGRWMRGTAHMPIVRQGVASVGNVALFAGTDGYADAVALDGDCSVFATPTLEVVHSVHNFTTPSRGGMVAAPDPVTHEVCFAGGNVFDQPKGSAPSRVVECFSTAARAVSRTFTLPTGMSGDSTTGGWLGGPKVAFFGAGGGSADSVALLHDGDWLASLTKAKARGFTACAGSGSTVVCAGGQGNGDSKHDESFSFATDVFVLNVDGSLASHNTSHALSVGRKKLSAAAQGDVVGFAMGFSDVNKTNGYSAQYDLFNTSDGTWFASGELPSGEGRQYGTALGCGGKLIFAGGQVAGGRSKAVDVYDVQAGAWWPASPQNLALSVARSNLAAACAMDRFAVFGGGQIPGSPAVDILDVETRLWSRAALNFGRGWLSAAGVGDCAVFAGGHPKTGPGSDIDVFCFAEGKSSRR